MESSSYLPIDEFCSKLDSPLTDVAVKQDAKGTVWLAASQSSSSILVYSFDSELVVRPHQPISMDGATAVDMALVGPSMLLAVAVAGAESNSSIWRLAADGSFQLKEQLLTVAAVDVLITVSDDVYVTFAQDPSTVDQLSDSWSQYSVPAKVFRYYNSSDAFYLFQKLDLDRIVSLTNLDINGMNFKLLPFRRSIMINQEIVYDQVSPLWLQLLAWAAFGFTALSEVKGSKQCRRSNCLACARSLAIQAQTKRTCPPWSSRPFTRLLPACGASRSQR